MRASSNDEIRGCVIGKRRWADMITIPNLSCRRSNHGIVRMQTGSPNAHDNANKQHDSKVKTPNHCEIASYTSILVS